MERRLAPPKCSDQMQLPLLMTSAVLQAQQLGPQDPHDPSGFSQAPGYPQQHLTPEQMLLAPGGCATASCAPVTQLLESVHAQYTWRARP